MTKKEEYEDLTARLERMEEILSTAATGDFTMQIPVDPQSEDAISTLEVGINLLISDMGEEVKESRMRADELEEKLKFIEKQREAIEELSTPIIKIWDQVLVLPLIGTIDTRRTQKLTESLLTSIEETQSKVTIIDITCTMQPTASHVGLLLV